MTKVYVPFLWWGAGLLSAPMAWAQARLPLLRATSFRAAIRDGSYLNKNACTLAPNVYTADRTRQAKWVTFYTDLDSIRVRIKPGTRTNFIILLNGQDSCYTQVASALPLVDKTPQFGQLVFGVLPPYPWSTHGRRE